MSSANELRASLWRIASAWIAASAAMWLAAGLWHSVLLPAFYETQIGADHEGKGITTLAYLLLGALMTYLYLSSRHSRGSLRAGIAFGAIIGVVWVLPRTLVDVGAHGEPLGFVFQNAAWHIVEQGVGGLALAVVWRGGSPASPS